VPVSDVVAWYLAPLLIIPAGCATAKPLMAVNTAVADLRAQPHTTAERSAHDPLEETQLLYGEQVRLLKEEDGWARVEAIEQPEFSHTRRWQGYPGWLPAAVLIPFESLLAPTIVVTEKWAAAWEDPYTLTPSRWRFPLGTRLRATEMGGQLWKVELLDGSSVVWLRYPSAHSLAELSALSSLEKRRTILRNAELLVGDAYYWGGRTPVLASSKERVTGVDCSGLINLAYRAAGVDIPRDAHEQFLRAKRVNALQPADLVFLSERSNPKRIVHVMLYAGGGDVIEGPGTGSAVRRIALVKRLGQPLDWLAPGAVIDGQTVFFGSYLP